MSSIRLLHPGRLLAIQLVLFVAAPLLASPPETSRPTASAADRTPAALGDASQGLSADSRDLDSNSDPPAVVEDLSFEPNDSSRVVVLVNGNAFAGTVHQRSDRVTITQDPGHSVRVPLRDVDFIVDSWREAYLAKRTRLRPNDINDQLKLAQWCMRYQLNDFAVDVLLEMSRQNPQHRAVRVLESQLNHRSDVVQATAARIQRVSFDQSQDAPSVVPVADENVEQADASVESASVAEYTRTIQPLLMNRCGMANCHASTGRSAFILQRVPTGKLTPKDLTWNNLRTVLKYVDGEEPQQSALFVKATTTHGNGRHAPLEPHESRQRNRLLHWLQSVSQDGSELQRANEPAATTGADSSSAPVTSLPTQNFSMNDHATGVTPLQRLEAAVVRAGVLTSSGRLGIVPPTSANPLSAGEVAITAGPVDEAVAESGTAVTASPGQTAADVAIPASKPRGPEMVLDKKVLLPKSRARKSNASSADPFDPAAFNARYHSE